MTGGDDDSRARRRVEPDADKRRDGLAAFRRAIFAHEHETGSRRVETAVGIAPVAGRGHRLWRSSGLQPVHALIGKLGVVDDAVRHDVGGAAVLVHTRPDIGRRRSRVNDPAGSIAFDDDASAPFGWPPLDPVDVVCVEHDPAQPECAGRDRAGADRRMPRPICRDSRLERIGGE